MHRQSPCRSLLLGLQPTDMSQHAARVKLPVGMALQELAARASDAISSVNDFRERVQSGAVMPGTHAAPARLAQPTDTPMPRPVAHTCRHIMAN